MIVPVTSEKYRNLFRDAELFLNLEEGDIGDLNTYYGYMQKFYKKAASNRDGEGYKFVMMPLDEETFNIDLNSRAISVPSTFFKVNGKVGGVQSDQMAELIIFETDRYFDYMDLANTHIYVQWQLPNAEQSTGATLISMKDLSKAGKIRFAWPLYNVITQYSGNVKFSVRFYLLEQQENEEHKLAYSLNTMEAELPIKPALNPSANIQPEQVEGLFEKSIINSNYTSSGRIPPLVPSFNTPGLNMTIEDKDNCFVRYMTEKNSPLKIQVAKLHDGKLTLKAQANSSDSGTITYDWKIAKDDNIYEDGSLRWESLNTPGTLTYEKAEFPIHAATGEPFLSNIDTYYKNLGTEEEPNWQVYTDSTIPEDIQLYEKYTYYSVPEDSLDVVGYYAVSATNTIDNLQSDTVWSSYCYLPGPAPVQFEKETFSQIDNTLKVNIVKDINNPDITYTWYRSALDEKHAINSAKNNKALGNDVEELGSNVQDLAPGWYAANIQTLLNKKSESTGTPEAYVVYAKAKIDAVEAEDSDNAYNLSLGKTLALQVNVTVNPPDGFTEDTISEKLYKNLTYKWQHNRNDSSEWIDITSDDISEENVSKLAVSLKDNVLTVRKPANETADIRRYRCIVSNNLGNKNSVIADTNIPIFTIVYVP